MIAHSENEICFGQNSVDRNKKWRRGGLVVECRTPERGAGGSILTQVAVLCPSGRNI